MHSIHSRAFNQANGTHAGLLDIVCHVRRAVPLILGYPGPAVGVAGGVNERRHVRAELHRRHHVLRENRTGR